MARCAALVLAGGRGSRFGGETPKQYQGLGDRVILRHAVDSFLSHPLVDDIRVVLRPDDLPLYDSAFGDLVLLPPVEGGQTRQESTRLGLESLHELLNQDTSGYQWIESNTWYPLVSWFRSSCRAYRCESELLGNAR